MARGPNGPDPVFLLMPPSFSLATPFKAGKFLITPLTRCLQGGVFSASLSIRRGQGSQTHDHVYTFKPEFASRDSALMYAATQGRYWLINPLAFA